MIFPVTLVPIEVKQLQLNPGFILLTSGSGSDRNTWIHNPDFPRVPTEVNKAITRDVNSDKFHLLGPEIGTY